MWRTTLHYVYTVNLGTRTGGRMWLFIWKKKFCLKNPQKKKKKKSPMQIFFLLFHFLFFNQSIFYICTYTYIHTYIPRERGRCRMATCNKNALQLRNEVSVPAVPFLLLGGFRNLKEAVSQVHVCSSM